MGDLMFEVVATTPQHFDALEPMFEAYYRSARRKFFPSWEETKEATLAALAVAIHDPNHLLFHIEVAGKPVAYFLGVAYPLYFAPSVWAAQELMIWVDEDMRKHGLGSKTLEIFERWAIQKGARISAVSAWMNMGPTAMGKMLDKSGYHLQQKTYSKVL